MTGSGEAERRARELCIEWLPCRHIHDVHYLIYYSLLKGFAGI